MAKNLSFRSFDRYSFTFAVIAVFTVVFLLAGCCIFGGKGKKKEAAEPAKEAKPVTIAPAEGAKPLRAAETTDQSKFTSDNKDLEVGTLNGVVNWSKGFVRATGYGVPPGNAVSNEQGKLMAFRAAYLDALANLLEITKGVHLTATTTVQDYMLKDYTIQTKVEGIIKGSKEVKRVFDEDKNVAVVEVGIAMEDVAMGVPREELSFNDSSSLEIWETKGTATLRNIAGDNEELSAAVESSENLDDIEKKLDKMTKDNEALASRNEELLASLALMAQEIDKLRSAGGASPNYTGVVVNAAGSGIKPCMAPNIYYKSGDTYKLLYGIEDGRSRDANMHALVVWENTLTAASDNTRVTQTPLIVNASYLAKEQSALAVTEDDAKMIEKVNQKVQLLEDGRVVIVR